MFRGQLWPRTRCGVGHSAVHSLRVLAGRPKNEKSPHVGQASTLRSSATEDGSSLPGQRARASRSVSSALPTEAGRMPALRCGSWKASTRFGACIGTMNGFVLVLVVVLVLENDGAGWGVEDENEDEDEWVGSWKASTV